MLKKTLGNIFFLFINSSAAASSSSGYCKQVTLFRWFYFFLLHIQIIWAKVYYLLYNINSKIFAFLLLSTDVLYCTGYKGTALRMRALQTSEQVESSQKKRWIFMLFHARKHYWFSHRREASTFLPFSDGALRMWSIQNAGESCVCMGEHRAADTALPQNLQSCFVLLPAWRRGQMAQVVSLG